MVSSVNSDPEIIDDPEFDNPKEEALYWKQVADEYLQKLQDVRDEFDEFQEGSRELESELEAQLEQYEQRVKDLAIMKSSLEEENEVLKEKLDSLQNDTYIQISALQDENVQMKAVKVEMTKYIRELEQTNDDLERAKRATVCSLEDFESRLNQAIERNAFLENELDEKEELMITVQRLKDEARDLKSELAVSTVTKHASFDDPQKTEPAAAATDAATTVAATTTTPRRASETDRQKMNTLLSAGVTPATTTTAGAGTPLKTATTGGGGNGGPVGTPLTPSARISALNIVSDLLRKVGALEAKLASCRNFVQEHPRNNKVLLANGIPLESPRSKSKAPLSVKKPQPLGPPVGLVNV